jgi:hypothetical protein
MVDIDKILLEWSWRCEKGYPDLKTAKDLAVLKQVLKEMNLPNPFTVLAEADAIDNPDVDDSLEASEFYKNLTKAQKKLLPLFINDIPLGQLVNSVTNLLLGLKGAEAKKYAKAFKSIDTIDALATDPATKKYTDWRPLWDLNVEKAMGRGELYIAFMVKDAVTQGSSKSFDIGVGSSEYEVKSLDSYNDKGEQKVGIIRPGAEGKASRHPYFTKPLMDLAGSIFALKDDELQTSILTLGTQDELRKVLQIVNDTAVVRPDSGAPITDTPGDVTRSVMAGLYKACIELNKFNPDQLLNKDVTTSRITIKSNTKQATYWVTSDDVDDIANAAGKDKEASIKVGSLVTDETKDAKILLTNLFQNEFVQDPNKFTDGLSRIKKGFFGEKAGLIYFLKGEVKVSTNMSDFATIDSSQDGYKFDLKSKYIKYPHVQNQS